MAYNIPTTQELVDAAVARFTDAINQTVPQSRQAFARIMSVCQSMAASGMYKLAADAIVQNLVSSADLENLKYIGAQYGVDYKYATASEIQVLLTGTAGTTVTSDNYWIGDSNGVRYEMEEDVVLSESFPPNASVALTAVARDAGEIGDLEPGGDSCTVGNYVSGLASTTYVTALNVEGINDEDTEDYRARIHNVLRSRGGGGNSADYRKWAEKTLNVIHAYPYGGRPYYDETDAGELITNGDFASDISGWTDNSTGDGAIVWNAGVMQLTTVP